MTHGRSLLPLFAAAAIFAPVHGVAQNPPLSPAQVQSALQQNPDLINQIRQRLAGSGLTPDQIRARLATSGYPPDLLDAYFGETQPGQVAPALGAQELAALQALGLLAPAFVGESIRVDTGFIGARARSV